MTRTKNTLRWRPALLIAGLALTIAACATPPAAPTLSEVERADLRRPILEAIDRGEIAGASLKVLVGGKEVFNEAHGLADIASDRPFTENEVVQIASSTKPITAAVFAILDEEGVLSLDEGIDTYLPEWADAKLTDGTRVRAPTFAELLSHTGGAPNDWEPVYEALFAIRELPTNADLSKVILERGLLFEPGTDYQYGGIGMSVAARAAEVAYGRARGEEKLFATILHEKILDPLGMADTSFHPSAETIAGMPFRYLRTGEGLRPMPKMRPFPLGTMVNGGGGLVSTADDLACFYEMLRRGGLGPDGRVMSGAAIARMVTPQPGATGFPTAHPVSAYGLGTILGLSEEGTLIEAGHGGAFGTNAYVTVPEDRVTVLMVQTPGSQVRDFTAALREALGSVFSDQGPETE